MATSPPPPEPPLLPLLDPLPLPELPLLLESPPLLLLPPPDEPVEVDGGSVTGGGRGTGESFAGHIGGIG